MNQQQIPTIGAPFEGGYFGGIVRVHAALFAIAWAPKAEGQTRGPWLPQRKSAPGADSCFDSLANTLAMAEAGSAIAKWALDLRIGGFDDWCLPARDVLELGYRHLKPSTDETICGFRDGDNPSSAPVGYPYMPALVQTSVQAFQAGSAEAFDPAWYWASTQDSESDAWNQNFSNGYQFDCGKTYEGLARAVRLIQLEA